MKIERERERNETTQKLSFFSQIESVGLMFTLHPHSPTRPHCTAPFTIAVNGHCKLLSFSIVIGKYSVDYDLG
jgi:hypothetical protein